MAFSNSRKRKGFTRVAMWRPEDHPPEKDNWWQRMHRDFKASGSRDFLTWLEEYSKHEQKLGLWK